MLDAAFLAAALACTPAGVHAVVGFWESENTSKGGIGHTLELKADGGALAATTVLVNMRYRVNGNRLVFDENTQGGTFRIEGDRLFQTGPDGSVVEKRRVGNSRPGKSIVGVWRFAHYAGGVAYERYTASGELQFRLALSSYPGCYSVASGKLTITQPSVSTTPYKIQGERLVLTQSNKPFAYVRVPGGAWYPREPLALMPSK
jgi:hypothetical protein